MAPKAARSLSVKRESVTPFRFPDVARARQKLLRWYRKHARHFPWRETQDPYSIWVSEIMLQQTTTQVVEPYFRRFMERFPTLEALASASEAEVLKIWEGLGYYRRAQHLLQAARILQSKYSGQFPRDAKELVCLPGIGRYTAGAILSLAFNQPVPILEANTKRLFRRWLGVAEESQPRAERVLWQAAEAFLTPRQPRVINLALMDLGSTVCSPRRPLCNQCPLREDCYTFQKNLPVTATPKEQKPVLRHEVAIILVLDGEFFMQRRSEGRWAGLWEFPRVLISEGQSAIPASHEVSLPNLADVPGLPQNLHVAEWQHLSRIRHQVTRFRIVLDSFLVKLVKGEQCGKFEADGESCWGNREELESLPMPSPIRRIVRQIIALNL